MAESSERERLSRLLIVDDAESQLRVLMDVMSAEGYDVIGCSTAGEAMEHVRRGDFGVAIVDLCLPDLDGTQLLGQIHALRTDVRVIINTGHASFESVKDALNLGAFAYVEKAGDPDELVRHVHAAARWHFDRYAQDLESEVASRTAELRLANNELRKEIEERRRAEKKRQELEAELRRSQRLEAIGQLAGGIAHDFNNILTAILGNVELSLERVRVEFGREHSVMGALQEIQVSALRAATLTRQLLTFSRRTVVQPTLLNLSQILVDLEKMLLRIITEDIELATHTEPNLKAVLADAGQLEQVIVNLVVNAADAMPDGGRLTLETRNVPPGESGVPELDARGAKPYVLLVVSDTGHGMNDVTLERIFEPFYTTKPLDKGTGLGLATVHGIVKQSGGHVSVESKPNRGTSFRIYLPAVDEVVEDRLLVPQAKALPPGRETILMCEDDRAVCGLVARSLRSAGYRVLTAGTGEACLTVARSHAGKIDLLITDVIMPDMNGRELSERLRAEHSDLPTLFISGYTSSVIAHHGVLNEGVQFLEKPFTRQGLLSKVRAVLSPGGLTLE